MTTTRTGKPPAASRLFWWTKPAGSRSRSSMPSMLWPLTRMLVCWPLATLMIRWGITSPIYQSKVLGEFPDLSDDTLILPKWIEAAQKRTLERTRRPIIAADIARFGEEETVIMRREGGWIRVYRAHHKADHDGHGRPHRQGHARHR